ncbi:hypothetical protein HPO96_16745 [Kribbella sandramycini]|uniref:Ig-like domain-containing protein n=1 Tax=Kribbella sandramycini TaxID=60450 RepID=A0A7Y4L283_9ACTN|nr:hypothetical protein [Kribbella sandramycini]MBB6565633.1 hypothetical protein [Kribbella sandramycini]NOL41896.1 hypothetical protein [Kribbella sandramycini]
MTNRRVLAALLAAPLVVTTLGVAPQAQAEPKIAITDLKVSRSSLAVSSLNTVPVTVTLDSTSTSDGTYFVQFKRVAGSGPEDELFSMPLQKVKPGTWSGVLNVPSTVNGTIKATAVVAGEWQHGVDLWDPTPVDGPTIAVTGVHIPKVVSTVIPKLPPYNTPYSIKWQVLDSQTGKPYGTKLKVMPREDNQCVEGDVTRTVLTDTNGVLTKKYPAGDQVLCFLLPGKPAPILRYGVRVDHPAVITATPSRTSAPVGTVVPVNGSIVGSPVGCGVNLQRLYGASQWRTVGSSTVRASGRFTLNAQPAYKGVIPYRAQFLACNHFVDGVSKTFTIKGI